MTQHPALAVGRAAVITGGASGIGFAAAKRFATLGMKICLADLSEEALDRARKQLADATVVTVRPQRRHRRHDRRVFTGPVEPGAGQKLYRAAIEAGVHAVAVELDLVQPLIAFRRRADELPG